MSSSTEVALPRSRPGFGNVTVADVAKLAGVSAMTVSRVFNRPEQVPPATVAKVRAAIDAIGYVPNRLAGGLRSSKSKLVAAIVPTLSGPIFLPTIESLTTHLAGHGYRLMVGQSGYKNPNEDELIEDLISRRPDGIVLTGVTHTEQSRKRLLTSKIPVIETWDLALDPIDMLVGFSHEAVGQAVCEFLMRKGRSRLSVIGGNDIRSVRRANSFASAAVHAGLAAPMIQLVDAPAKLGDGRRALAALLSRSPEVDAVFCSSDLLALGVLLEAKSRGLEIPTALSIVGFGDLDFATDLDPPLTTVRIDSRRIGELAANCIVSRARNEPMSSSAIDVGFTLVERLST